MFRLCIILAFFSYLQWDTADAEIKVPSVENPELLQVSPVKLVRIGHLIAVYA